MQCIEVFMQQRTFASLVIIVVVLLSLGATLVSADPLRTLQHSSPASTMREQALPLPPMPAPTQAHTDSSTEQVHGAAHAGAANTVYLPMVRTHIANVRIAAIEVTQATQTPDNSVPIIANRPALARLHLEGAYSVGSLVITLSGSRAGTPLPGSPLVRTVPPGPYANILLPQSWLNGDISLHAEVKLANGNPNDATVNARMETGITFIDAPSLDITIVPIEYTHQPNGAVYSPPTTFHFLDSVQRMFPVPHINVTVRAPYSAQGNIENSGWWSSFVTNEVMNLARADGAPLNAIYIAVLPLEIMNDMRPALAGIGFSNRMVLSFDYALVATHELGHALGRKHTNCGNPDSRSVDPDYPYQDGVIGAPGYDVVRDIAYEPSKTRDIMSYCEEWVSDYTYRGMLQNQLEYGHQPDGVVADALLVSANLSEQSNAQLGPVYALRTLLSPPATSSDYEVALYAVNGTVIATYGVPVHTTLEEEISLSQFGVALPRPQEPVARVALLHKGVEIDSRTITLERTNRIRMSARIVGTNLLVSSEYLTDPGILSGVTLSNTQIANASNADTPEASGGPRYLLRYHSGILAASGSTDIWTTLSVNASAQTQDFALDSLPAAPDGNATIEYIPADTLLVTPQGQSKGASVITTITVGASDLGAHNVNAAAIANHAPAVWFGEVTPVALGDSVILAGYASDLEDGAIADIEWSINGAPAATGPILQISAVDQPMHIELSASDAQGERSTATLQIAPY